MVDEVNRRKDVFKKQQPDATEEEIVESVQSQQIEVLGTVLKFEKEKRSEGWDEQASETWAILQMAPLHVVVLLELMSSNS